MARKQSSVSRRMVFAWLMLASWIILFAPQRLTSRCQLLFAGVFGGPLSAGRMIEVYTATDAPADVVARGKYNELAAAHQQLTHRIANLQMQLDVAQEQINTLQGLRVQSQWSRMRFLLAGVVAASGAGEDELFINRGQDDGLAVGQYVISPRDQCVVGRISAVLGAGAKIQLFTHPSARTEVRIAGLNLRGLMRGKGLGQASIPWIETKYRLQAGDLVHAAADPGLLDAPVVIGRIGEPKRSEQSPLFWDIAVEPAANVSELTEVAVVVSNLPRPG